MNDSNNITEEIEDEFVFKTKVLYNQLVHIPTMLTTLKNEFPQFFASDSLKLNYLPMSLQDKINSNILIDINKPTKSYCSKFIKMLTDTLERLDKEVNESILEKYLDIINCGSATTNTDEIEYCWKSYYVEGKWITLKNENVFNLVGMTTWGAAYLLSDFILENKSLFENKNILELGSGTGLAGIVLDYINPLKKVILTDYSPKVLKNLKDNIELNNIGIDDLINDEDDCSYRGSSNKFIVKVLDWEIEDLTSLDKDYSTLDNSTNIILGADIVYEPSLARYLVSILQYLLKKNKDSVAYISSTIRNQSTFAIFQQELNDKQLIVEDITSNLNKDNSSPFIYDKSQIVLYKIYSNK